MTRITSAPLTDARTSAPSSATTTLGLRSLHLIRAVFSLVWVVLVLTTTSSLDSGDGPTAVAAVLLVVYPLWDLVATLLERRMAGAGPTDRLSRINLGLDLAATVAMVVAVLDTVGTALLVFGIWALLSGAIQLVVAIGRRRTVGTQWPMIISGGLSVLAGGSFAATSRSSGSGLSSVAGYSAFGAFWVLVSAVVLTVRSRRATR